MAPRAGSGLLDGYGSIGAEVAREVVAAAIGEGTRQSWAVAVAIVDRVGELVLFERIDNTQPGSIQIAQDKARTAARFRRSTKVFEDALAGGRQVILGLAEILPLEGGIPLIIDGAVVGAIGVSGATAQQDGICAQAGFDALARLTAEPADAVS
jgi:glc operon protein GlcG